MYFIVTNLLDCIWELLLDNPQATDMQVYEFLYQEARPNSAVDIMRVLSSTVKICPRATTGPKRLLSLMQSLKVALKKIGLGSSTTNDDEFILPFSVQKDVLLSKLPPDFRTQFEVFAQLRKDATDYYQLFNQLTIFEKGYSGPWTVEEVRPSIGLGISPFDEYQSEHSYSLRKKRTTK